MIDPKSLWRRYVLALSLVALLATSVFSLSYFAAGIAEHHSIAINIAGYQRSLSQRIVLLANRYADTQRENERAPVAEQLKAAIEMFAEAHHGLIEGDVRLGLSEELPAELQELYFGETTRLDQRVKIYIKLAKKVLYGTLEQRAFALPAMNLHGPGDLLQDLDRATELFSQEARNAAGALKLIEFLALLSALAVIAFEALFIFRPAHREVVRGIAVAQEEMGKTETARDEAEAAKKQLELLAYHDGLTGLANRARCQKDLAERFARADRDDTFALIHLDLDNFKRINDTLGHAAGDEFLREVGRRLSILTEDFNGWKSYRWGGDEFVIIVSDTGVSGELSDLCQEITDIMSVSLDVGGAQIWPTASLGVARYPGDGEDLESLMIFADLALYRTKELGRDGYQFFTTEMKEKIDSESWLENELRSALELDQLFLVFQPQVDVSTLAVTGVEALLRWQHPERGLIMPGEFLPVVEQTRLAERVGQFVFREAMKSARMLLDKNIDFGRLAVNMSPQHLRLGTAFDDFTDAMREYRIEPSQICAEVLESLLLDDPDADRNDTIRLLHELGVHVELDDFGTGYASLSHLSSLPIDGLKVDRSFVKQMQTDTKQSSVVKTLIDLTRVLDISVVCEGVETHEQLELLKDIGRCSIQGYLIARPMPLDDLTGWIRTGRNLRAVDELPVVQKLAAVG